jgi:tetrahydromethanopterin S-methyltransferase subunit D
MEPTAAAGAGAGATATSAGGGTADASAAGSGNPGLQQAFDSAIQQAQQTLEITTKNGAILYSLKQSVR